MFSKELEVVPAVGNLIFKNVSRMIPKSQLFNSIMGLN